MRRTSTGFGPLLLGALVTLASSVACAPRQTEVFRDPRADFSALRTFAWFPQRAGAADEGAASDPTLYRAAYGAVERKLLEKGYSKAAPGAADFLVLVHLALERALDVETMDEAYRGGTSEWDVHRTIPEEWTAASTEVTLVVDVLDAGRRRLVWRGTAHRHIADAPEPSQIAQRTSEILERFPAADPASRRSGGDT